MTTFTEKQQAISRVPITLVRLTMDTCGNVFGAAPCAATGEPCYNTYPTCKDRVNFARQTVDYEYTKQGPVPLFPGPRPYVKTVNLLETEIRDTLAVKGRVSVTMVDEPELTDIGLDPYVDQRASSPAGSYWKKFLARNSNYQNRPAVILEGYEGIQRSEFKERWRGQIENITLSRGKVTFNLVDPLNLLDDISVPPEVEIELVAPILATSVSMTLAGDVDLLPDAGHIRIDDEILSYSAFNRSSNVASGIVRGLFGTTAEPGGVEAGTAVKLVTYVGPINPFDLLLAFLTNDPEPATAYPGPPGAGIPVESIDVDSINYWRDYPGGEPLIAGVIEDSTDLKDIVIELLDLIDVAIWYSEAQQVTIRRNLPNDPGSAFVVLTDRAHVVDNSGSADLNDSSRNTRVTLHWERRGIEDASKTSSFRRIDQARDVDAESVNEYGEIKEQRILSRFLTTTADTEENVNRYVSSVAARRLFRTRDANPKIIIDVERKDSDIKTGDQIAITTDELLNPDGSPLVNARGIVTKRGYAGDNIRLTCTIYSGPKYLAIAPDSFPDDYADGTPEQQAYGCITDDLGRVGSEPGFAIY